MSNAYEDITWQVLSSRQEHYKGNEKITIGKTFEYDAQGRLLATRQKINDQAEITLSAMAYNELGELSAKYLHSKQTSGQRSFLQQAAYTHNIRGWLTGINDPANLTQGNALFGMKLLYENTTGMGSLSPTAMYNGNIAGMIWNTSGDKTRGYAFSYDNLNRLLKASYAEGTGLSDNAGYFDEEITGYDNNGNIKGLKRNYNNTTVDNLTYAYFAKTNQLQKIADAGTSVSGAGDYPGNSNDYAYDANGNMVRRTIGGTEYNLTYDAEDRLVAAGDGRLSARRGVPYLHEFLGAVGSGRAGGRDFRPAALYRDLFRVHGGRLHGQHAVVAGAIHRGLGGRIRAEGRACGVPVALRLSRVRQYPGHEPV